VSCRLPWMTLEPACRPQEACRETLLIKPVPMPKQSFRFACIKRTVVS